MMNAWTRVFVRSRAWRALAVVLAGLVAGVAVLVWAGPTPAGAAPQKSHKGPTSIVQMGDSVAAGEGILYDFSFDKATGHWQGPGNPNPSWLGPYPECHQSPEASGFIIAKRYPKAKFTQLACTGSTFAAGVEGPWSATVPPQFGNWTTKVGLNARYSAASPNLVLVSLGANDVQFLNIVKACVAAFLVDSTTPQCTAAAPKGPGDVIGKDFTSYLPTLNSNLTKLITWIRDRAVSMRTQGRVRIVFTNYPDMLPTNGPRGGKNLCPDTWLLSNNQLRYLSSQLRLLDADIISTVDGYARSHRDRYVTAVNLLNAYGGHDWCAKNKKTGDYITPDAYGFSILKGLGDLFNPNPAPFHPTPEGQQAIAARVAPVVAKLFAR